MVYMELATGDADATYMLQYSNYSRTGCLLFRGLIADEMSVCWGHVGACSTAHKRFVEDDGQVGMR